MQEKIITEGKAKIKIYEADSKIVSKELPVFYNPLMKFNRDISVLLLNNIENENMRLADPMAGSGIRAVRFLKELKENKLKFLYVNDLSEDSINKIHENLELNNLKIDESIILSNNDANLFMLNEIGFDYVDIDPFGSPNLFLDAAVKRVSRGGILAVTATDTAPLSGTYPKTGMRKYWARTIRNEHKHESGVRILIRKCQLVAAQYERAITPILSYSVDHYFRIFFRVEKGKQKADKILAEHGFFHYCNNCSSHKTSKNNNELCCGKNMDFAGPMWLGDLFNTDLLEKMNEENKVVKNTKILNTFLEESKVNSKFFYDIHSICKNNKLELPKTEVLSEKIRSKGFSVSRTHFLLTAIKSDIDFKSLLDLIK